MMQEHAKLKSIALLNLETFLNAFCDAKKKRILCHEKIDISTMLKMEEYINFNQSIADLNKYLTDHSTPVKAVK